MATVPLNLFKNVTVPLSTYDPTVALYTAPFSRAAIVLATQVANITHESQTVTVQLSSAAFNTTTFLISGFSIPPYDAANIAMGKIVLTEGDKLLVWSGQNQSIHATISILETINTPA